MKNLLAADGHGWTRITRQAFALKLADNGNVLTQAITRWDPVAQATQTWNQTFTYDGLNRLWTGTESASANGTGSGALWMQTFGYDYAGNRWLAANVGSQSQPYSPSNEAPQASGWFGSNNQIVQTGWSYDGAGNITNFGGVRTATYDAENRMVTSSQAGLSETYGYDGEGRRVTKTGSAGTTVYVYDAAGELASEVPAVVPTTGGTTYLSVDALGSTRLVTDGAGNQEEWLDYLPFGEQAQALLNGRTSGLWSGTEYTAEKKFTGKERDAETGLDYFGARYMSSAQGRFTGADQPFVDQHPQDPQSWNLYAYVRNNPLVLIDPNGTDCVHGTDAGSFSVVHGGNSDLCSQSSGTWVPGTVDENERSGDVFYNPKTGLFQVTSKDENNVYYATFASSARTDESGHCQDNCAGADIVHKSKDWLSNQLVGDNTIDRMMHFMANKSEKIHGLFGASDPGILMKLLSGPLAFWQDHWAGPGGMGAPQGQGDWAAMVHDSNFDANGITMRTYASLKNSNIKAQRLIQSDNNLIRNAGGIQGAKMGLFFGVVNAFQWYVHTF